MYVLCCSFCFQAEDGIRDLVRSRGLGDVYKRQGAHSLRFDIGDDRDRRAGVGRRLPVQPTIAAQGELSLIHI